MKNKALWVLLSCLMVLSLVLASCGTAATPEEEEGATVTGKVTETEKEIAKEEEKEAEEEEEVTGPQYGGTLTVLATSGPLAWDPAAATWTVEVWSGTHNEKPMVGDLEGKGPRGDGSFDFAATGQLPRGMRKGALAESWEWPDPLTLIFNVRKGVHFHNKPPANGRELDAEDMALSLSRIWNIPRFKTGYWSFVDSIEATDKYTVEISFNRYDTNWEHYLGTGWYVQILPRELIEQDLMGDWEYGCGTGPFIMDDFVSDVSAVWVRNNNYWDKTTIDGKEYSLPFVDSFRRVIIPDSATYLSAMRTGKLDFIPVMDAVKTDQLKRTCPDLTFKSFKKIGATPTLIMRTDTEPTNDIRVRKALWMAIDYDDMIEKLYMGDADCSYTFIVPAGWSPSVTTPVEELPSELVEGYSYNQEKARQLLSEAGYPNGFTIEILVDNLETHVDISSLLASYWSAIDVKLNIKTEEASVHQVSMRERIHKNLCIYNWVDTPLNIITQLAPGTLMNYSNWDDAQFGEMINGILAEQDEETLNEKIKAIDVYQALSFTTKTLLVPYVTTAWWPWVKNYYGEKEATYIQEAPIAARIWIDQELKKEMGY